MNMALHPPPDTAQEHQQRLLKGMAQALVTKGYAASTIADIVAQASVSRRTFYEHFETKAACFLALYEAVSLEGLSVLQRELQATAPWQEQVEFALAHYFGWLGKNPVLLRTLFIDILALGPDGLRVRRSVHDEIARFIAQRIQLSEPGEPAPQKEILVALVGGIHELVLQQIEKGDLSNAAQLASLAAQFVRKVVASENSATKP